MEKWDEYFMEVLGGREAKRRRKTAAREGEEEGERESGRIEEERSGGKR